MPFQLTGGDKWRCELPESEWPENPEIRSAIRADFEGTWGDRRQEIVLIGLGMQQDGQQRLHAALHSCLLTDDEWAAWERVMRSRRATDAEKKEQLEQLFEDG